MSQFDVADLHAQIHAATVSLKQQSSLETINACLQCAQQIQTACRLTPDTALAYFICTLPDTGNSGTKTVLRSLTLLCLTSRRDAINEHSLLHLMAATLLAYALAEHQNYAAKGLKKQLLQAGLSQWLGILRLSRSLRHSKAHQLLQHASLNTFERRVLSACHLSLVTPRIRPALALRNYIQRTPTLYRLIYRQWLRMPGDVSNGHQVTTSDGRRGAVLSTQREYVAVAFNEGDTTVCEWLPLHQVFLLQGRAISFDQWKVLFARHESDLSVANDRPLYPVTFPVHRPPNSLTEIIDALHAPDSDIDALVTLIDQEPSFSSFLMSSASLDNRMQLPVSSLKQAILTFGLARVGDMLVQHALIQRLTQHRFLLDGLCHQYSVLMASIAAHLSANAMSRFTPQSAALTATFLSAPLFTLADIKVMSRLPLSDTNYFDPNHLLRLKLDTRWQSLAGELASGWHQEATWRALLHHAGKPPASVPASLRREHCILQVAQILARQWLFGHTPRCQQTENVLLTGLHILGVEEKQVTSIQNSVGAQLVCPLAV